MHTPAVALAWELWRKHRTRVITIAGLVLGFALVYPKLCALAGFDPNNPGAVDMLAKRFALQGDTGPLPLRVVRTLYLLFLACGPASVMILTLLYTAWMFTFTERDPKARDPMTFPARLFTLPVSTPFLFWSLWLGGMAAIAMLYGSWVHFVPLSRLDVFVVYQNCFGWMTLLALGQGIVWALAAWPNTRTVLLAALLFGFLGSPARRDIFESPLLLPSLFVLGSVLARVGLQKMRHSQWQGWTWKWPFATISARAELRGPKRFASPAQAQLWFEWRRFARGLCFTGAVLVGVPLVIYLLRLGAGFGPLSQNTMLVLACYLVAIPLITHFCTAASPPRTDVSFLMVRPLTNGQMMMATLQAAARSSLLSWMIVAAALCAMPLLGDFHAVEKFVSIPSPYLAIIVPGLILLTWRFIAVNLGFVGSGNRRLAAIPVLMMVAVYAGVFALSILSRNSAYWNAFWRLVPGLLAGLIAVKFLLAFLAFRLSLKRGLLAPFAVVAYLAVWTPMVAALLVPAAVLLHDTEWLLPSSLGIVLLVPLDRIGFCPIALAWNRHE